MTAEYPWDCELRTERATVLRLTDEPIRIDDGHIELPPLLRAVTA